MPIVLTTLETLLLLGGILLIGMSLLAPFEALGWWAGWLGGAEHRDVGESSATKTAVAPDQVPASQQDLPEGPRYFAVYLSGVGDVSGDFAFPEEIALLKRLKEQSPDTVVIDDIFPYSVINAALTGRGTFVWLWKWLVRRRSAYGDSLLTSLINIRNFLQVLVCSDGRYGPLYGYGTAKLIRESLSKAGYPFGSGKPLTMIGFSGGAQMCVSAAPFLRVLLRAPVQVAAIGGVLCDDPGLRDVSNLYYLYGTGDWVQWVMALMFPGRWSWLSYSNWNRALRSGKIVRIPIGPMGHNDPGGYFDAEARLPNGHTHAGQTLAHLLDIIHRSDKLEPLPHGLAGVEGLESVNSQNWDFESQPSPARSWQQALEIVGRLQRLDRDDVNPVCRTVLHHHDHPTERVFVLLHGFTNCPWQWHAFANELFQSEANVLVPRLPRHGLEDRLNESFGDIRAEELIAGMDTAVDAARGLGQRVTLIGISLGAVLAAWTIQHRDDIDTAVLIAPSFGFRLIPKFLESRFLWLTGVAPNLFFWWDPRIKEAMTPPHAYPRFATRALHQIGRITRDVLHESARNAPKARHVVIALNEADLAVRNETTEEIIARWREHGYTSVTIHTFPRDLGLIHDIVDPAQAEAKISTVYPILLRLALGK
ncbi:MAG TPA: alpha/beta fold hydrolase [Bryobacteraceae bacterium]|nr:alpha/beta fold hydrolase [Bryobacteraceae bacterium]